MQRRGSGHRLARAAHWACGWRLRIRGRGPISAVERLARASASPTRSGPEGSSRNEPRLGRCPASHLFPFMPLRCGKPLAGKGLAWWPLRDDASGCRRTSVPSGTMGCSDHRSRRIAPHSGAQRSRPYRPLRTTCAPAKKQASGSSVSLCRRSMGRARHGARRTRHPCPRCLLRRRTALDWNYPLSSRNGLGGYRLPTGPPEVRSFPRASVARVRKRVGAAVERWPAVAGPHPRRARNGGGQPTRPSDDCWSKQPSGQGLGC